MRASISSPQPPLTLREKWVESSELDLYVIILCPLLLLVGLKCVCVCVCVCKRELTLPGFHLISVPFIILSPFASRAYSFDNMSFSKYGFARKYCKPKRSIYNQHTDDMSIL